MMLRADDDFVVVVAVDTNVAAADSPNTTGQSQRDHISQDIDALTDVKGLDQSRRHQTQVAFRSAG